MNQNKNMTKKIGTIKKTAAVTLTAAMLVQSTAVTALAAETAKKEEVVYANLDGTGAVTGIYVVNSVQGKDITDYGDYTSVKNLTTADEILLEKGKVTLHTDADKVYYQGNLKTKEIPWKIAVTYQMDGKEYLPEEIAGQSGSLKMNVKITQNESCDASFWEGYALQVTMTLDAAACKNIKAEQATIANVGADKQLSYIILPGKGANLTITADVTDFEMDEISINGVKMNLDMDMDESELTEEIKEIQDAVARLNDGADALLEGADSLDNGASDLKDGAKELNDGMTAFGSGVESLKTGTDSLSSGAEELNDGAGTLAGGLSDAYLGSVSVNDGAKLVDDGMISLNQGIYEIQTALIQLQEQSGTLTNGSAQVKAALSQMKQGLDGVSMNTEELQQLADSSKQIQNGINGLTDGLETLSAAIASYQQATAQAGASEIVQKNEQAAAALQITDTQRALYDAYVNGGEEAVLTKMGELAAAGEAEATALYQCAVTGNAGIVNNYIAMAGKLINLEPLFGANASYINGSDALISGISAGLDGTNGELMQGAVALSSSYAQFDAAIAGMVETLGSLSGNLTELKSGIDTLAANYESLDGGIATYTGVVQQITAGYQGLTDGAKELANGTSALYQGTQELVKGTENLKTGAGTLA